MKTYKYLLKCALLTCVLNIESVNHQIVAQPNFISANLSYNNVCPVPVSLDLMLFGTATGYSSFDNVGINVFWGDGTSTLDSTSLGWSGDTFYFTKNHVYSFAGNFTAMVIAAGPDQAADTTYVNVVASSQCVTVSGYAYYDNNTNCTYDSGDDPSDQRYIHVALPGSGNQNSSIATYTDQNGYYSFTVPSGGTGLTIHTETNPFDTITCPSSGFYTFNSTSNQSFSFGIECFSNTVNRGTDHAFSGVGAPGDTGIISYFFHKYACNNDSNYTVTLNLDPNVSFLSLVSGPTPTTQSSNVLTWTTNLIEASGSFLIFTSTSATLFDTAVFTLTITESDPYMDDNMDLWKLEIGGPYDPNNKEVSPEGYGPEGNVIGDETFTFTVNFQNTGTASAQNVFILDSLSEHLDLSTFSILGSSHPMSLNIHHGRLARFDFQNINLPDSNTNEPNSHGWVMYKIKAKTGLPLGTEILNTANIYFDYNEAIVTNTTINTISEFVIAPLSLDLNALPVTCIDNSNGQIDLTIISGNAPIQYAWSNGATTQDLDELSAGTYTVTVTDNENQQVIAFANVESHPIYAAPEAGPILGTLEVAAFEVYYYNINPSLGSAYTWGASGGEILGWVNNTIEVLWHGGPTGKLWVEERDQHGCLGFDTLAVPILFVGIAERENHSFSVFPNPASDEITIKVNDFSGHDQLSMQDVQGRVIGQWSMNSSEQTISIEGVAPGLYFLSVGSQSADPIKVMIR